MAKNYKNNNNEPLIPPGEDQYLLGWDDAEKLEKTKPGLAKTFIKFSSIVPGGFHEEYIKGFGAYIEKHIPKTNTVPVYTGEEIAKELLKLLEADLNKKLKK